MIRTGTKSPGPTATPTLTATLAERGHARLQNLVSKVDGDGDYQVPFYLIGSRKEQTSYDLGDRSGI